MKKHNYQICNLKTRQNNNNNDNFALKNKIRKKYIRFSWERIK